MISFLINKSRPHQCPKSAVIAPVSARTLTRRGLLAKVETGAGIRASESATRPLGITSRLSWSSEMFEEAR